MTRLRAVIILAACLGVGWLMFSTLVSPIVQAFVEQADALLAQRARLANLSAPPDDPDAATAFAGPVVIPVYLDAATSDEAAAHLSGMVQALIPPDASLISAVPVGALATPAFLEERIEVALRMDEGRLSTFVIGVENSTPTLRFNRLSVRRADEVGLVVVEASIVAFRSAPAAVGVAP
jgi:hypothetical protein